MTNLDEDAWTLHRAISSLVSVYQFRDRQQIFYYDVSANQCYAIAALVYKGPLTLNKLAKDLRLDKSTTSRMIDILEQKGYVSRLENPVDARVKNLVTTDKGRKLHNKIESDLVEGLKEMLAEFDPDVRHATARLVTMLAKTAKNRFSVKINEKIKQKKES